MEHILFAILAHMRAERLRSVSQIAYNNYQAVRMDELSGDEDEALTEYKNWKKAEQEASKEADNAYREASEQLRSKS